MKFFKKKANPIVTELVITETQQENELRAVSNHNIDIPTSIHVINTPQHNFRRQCCTKENLKEQALLIATIAAVLIGIGVGIALRGLKCPEGKGTILHYIFLLSLSYR
jgi:uncharacterized membrane-anchored protein YitT (DUF2179 family)